jgi:hypothetical protein
MFTFNADHLYWHHLEKEKSMIKIQVLFSIVWNTQIVIEDANSLPTYMDYVKQNYPNNRVRAVDGNGRILDMIA